MNCAGFCVVCFAIHNVENIAFHQGRKFPILLFYSTINISTVYNSTQYR